MAVPATSHVPASNTSIDTSTSPPQFQFLPPHITIDSVTSTFITTTNASSSTPAEGPIGTFLPLTTTANPNRSSPAVARGVALPLTATSAAAQKDPPIIRRDSLHRRETRLTGKFGIRRRQRWENGATPRFPTLPYPNHSFLNSLTPFKLRTADHLLSNPHINPPTPADFLPAPTHPSKVVHYDIACLWEAKYQQHHLTKRNAALAAAKASREAQGEGQIPRKLKMELKKAKGAVGIVRMLEDRIRDFLESVTAAAHADTTDSVPPTEGAESGPEEEERERIVLTPKYKHNSSGSTTVPASTIPSPVPHALPIYHSRTTDPSAPFIRWLVHSIAGYYGLHSWSVTEPTPPSTTFLSTPPFSSTPSSTKGKRKGKSEGKGGVRVTYVGLRGRDEKMDVKSASVRGGIKRAKGSGSEVDQYTEVEEDWVMVEGAKAAVAATSTTTTLTTSTCLREIHVPKKLPRPLWAIL